MVSIVIPAYNEEGAIGITVSAIMQAVRPSEGDGFEIIVVDDGSNDRTAEEAVAAGACVLRNLTNTGYGFSLKRGIYSARFDTIIIMDGDGTYPAQRVPELLGRFREGYDLVVGARTGEHYHTSLFKTTLRFLFKWLVEFTVGQRVPDVNSGLRVFSRGTIKPYLERFSNKFSFTTSQTMAYMLTRKYVLYIPIEYHERTDPSKVRLLRDALGALQMITSAILYFNPLKLFLALCVILASGGIAAIIVGWWLKVGVLIVAGAVALPLTIVVAALGFVADVVRQTSTFAPVSIAFDRAANASSPKHDDATQQKTDAG